MSAVACDYFARGECGSCTLLALPADQRAAYKFKQFADAASRALSPAVTIAALWQPRTVFPSRTKAKLTVSGSMSAPVIGLVERRAQSADLLDCPLHLPQLNEVLHTLKRLIPAHKLAPYHIERQQGELKGLILKSNESGSEVIVRFVLRSQEALAKVRRAARELQKAHAFVKVVSANIQPLPAALLEGDEEILITEQDCIWESFGGVQVAFQPQSFSQVTHETAVALYGHVAALVKKTGTRSLFDLFCGVGGFSLVAAQALDWARGIELAPRAIASAQQACARNGIGNLEFAPGDVEGFLDAYKGPVPDAVLFNPPRRGLSAPMITRVKALAPARVFYSSCNPETLLRDLGLFAPDYEVKTLASFDMFPLTEHLEVVVWLEKGKS